MRLSNERTLRAPTTRTDDDAHATHVCVCACTYAHAHTHSRMHRRASQHMHRIQRRQHNTTRAGPAGARAFVIDAVATVSSLPFEYRSSTDRVRAGAPVIHPGHPPAITPVRDQTLASSGNGRNVSQSALPPIWKQCRRSVYEAVLLIDRFEVNWRSAQYTCSIYRPFIVSRTYVDVDITIRRQA